MENFTARFVWHQHFTRDLAKAKAFYAALFGWRYRMLEYSQVRYAVIRKGGREIGGMASLDQFPGEDGRWLPIASCMDIEEQTALAESMDAQMVIPPTEVDEIGCLTAMLDPQGAPFMLLCEELPNEARRERLPGFFYWDELATTAPKSASIFYRKLMNWKSHTHELADVGVYTIFREQSGPTKDIAGMHRLPGEDPQGSHWTCYISVHSVEEAVERACELDGAIRVPPTTIPGIGRFALLIDSQQVPFAVIEVAGGRSRSGSGRVQQSFD